jgi:MFS family permease
LVDLSAALSQREFWVIAVWLVLYAYSFAAMSFHLVPLLREYGLSADRAALAQSVLGVGSLCGNLLAGALLDRVHAPRLATVFAIVPMCGIGLLVCFPGAALAYVMAATLGVAAGSETSILTYLLGRYFAGSVLGRVTSIQFIALATGAALGPFVAAILHDRYGNYHLLLLANAGTFAVAASAPLLLRQYRS